MTQAFFLAILLLAFIAVALMCPLWKSNLRTVAISRVQKM